MAKVKRVNLIRKLFQLFSSPHKRYSMVSSPRMKEDVWLTNEINKCARFKPSGVQGSEIHLVDYSAAHGDGYPVFASVLTDLADESIYLYKIPKQYYGEIETHILSFLTHEILHKVMLKVEGQNACGEFDNLFDDNNSEKKLAFCELFVKAEFT